MWMMMDGWGEYMGMAQGNAYHGINKLWQGK
jgi:hypothetical protein